MHQFWTTIKKIENLDVYNFKMEKKKFRVDTEVFREILQICPRILNQDFIAPLSEEEPVTFIQELRYSGRCNMLSAIHTDQMHQPWRTFAAIINREISSARKEHMPYPRFTKVIMNHFIYKDKTIFMRNMIKLHTICDDSLLGTLKFVSKTQDYQQYEALIPDDMINQDIKNSEVYKTYYDFATGKVPPRKARKYKKVASPSSKSSHVKEAEPIKKGKKVKRPAKKSTTTPTTSVVIIDTPGVYVSMKKAPAKDDRSKSIEILSDVALSEATQLKEATKRSKKDFHISQESGSGEGTNFESGVPDEKHRKKSSTDEGTGTKPGVPDVPEYQYKSDDESWGDSKDDKDDKDDDDNENNDDNKDYKEEEHDEEYESDDDNENVFEEEDDDLYKYVDVRSLGAEQEQERKCDEKMSDADQNKTESSKQSSYISSDFVSKFLILENIPPAVDEVASMMNSTINESLKNVILAKSSSQPKSTYEAAESLTEFELKKILLDKIKRSESYKNAPEHKELYEGLVKSYNLEKYLFSSYGNVYSLKRDRDDKDKDEDPFIGSEPGLKKQKKSMDAEPPKGSKLKESKTSSSKGTKSHPKSSGKSVQAEEPATPMDDWFKKPNKPLNPDRPWNDRKSIDSRSPHKWISNISKARQPPRTFDELMSTPIDFSTYIMHNLKIDNMTQEILVGLTFNLLKGTCKSFVELEYHFEECYKAVTGQLDWNNP
nr:hypothetical protein [Tanacetum cinerariifolium]